MLIFCMMLIFALILTTFGISFICFIDDKKSQKNSNVTTMAGGLDARGVAKYSDFGSIEGHIWETVQYGR